MAVDSISMRQPLGVIGVPTSAGAFAPGQEDAPARLREAGLIELLRDNAVDVRDHGDREPWRWRPDRERPRAQNLDKVLEIVSDTARRVEESALANEATLVLGGDCTVGIGTVAGHQGTGERVGLVYFDAHADLNIPESVREGALDWMGMAHMLGLPGTERALVEAGSRAPCSRPNRWCCSDGIRCRRPSTNRKRSSGSRSTSSRSPRSPPTRRRRRNAPWSCSRIARIACWFISTST